MITNLSPGSTVGGYKILTTKDIPIKFRYFAASVQYSLDNGVTWKSVN